MPERVRNATDIEKALVEWDAMYKVYTEACGCALSDHRKVGVLMRMLPASLNEDVLKEFNKFDEQPEALSTENFPIALRIFSVSDTLPTTVASEPTTLLHKQQP